MRTRHQPDRDGRPGANALLVTLADFGYHVPVGEQTVEVTADTDDTRREPVDDAVPIDVHTTTDRDTDPQPGAPFQTQWVPGTSLQPTLQDVVGQSSPPPVVRGVTMRTLTGPDRPASVHPHLLVDPALTDASTVEPHAPEPSPIPDSPVETTLREYAFDAPPETASVALWGPEDASVRLRSRLRVDGLLVALATEYGAFPVRELVWDLDTEEYETFRDRYDAGASGGAGVWATDASGRVLMVRHAAESAWSEPGGKRELGETFETAAEREFEEETGIEPRITGVQEVHAIVHTDLAGDRAPIVSPIVVFRGTASGTPSVRDGEIAAAQWWDEYPDDLLYPAIADFPLPATQ